MKAGKTKRKKKKKKKKKKKHFARQFNFTYRYVDSVLSLNKSKFSKYLELILPREFERKETSKTDDNLFLKLDFYLSIDNGKLTTRLNDKGDDFIEFILVSLKMALCSCIR